MNEENTKSKVLRIGAIILALIGSNAITFLITQQIQVEADWELIIEKTMPTIIAVLIGIAAVLGKQDVFNKIFESLINNANQTFTRAANNVNSVTASSTKIETKVDEMKEDNIELRREITNLSAEVKEAIKMKAEITTLVKKFDIMVTNDPNLIKNGVANKVLKVGESDEEKTTTT